MTRSFAAGWPSMSRPGRGPFDASPQRSRGRDGSRVRRDNQIGIGDGCRDKKRNTVLSRIKAVP